jgi:hypothetical protein
METRGHVQAIPGLQRAAEDSLPREPVHQPVPSRIHQEPEMAQKIDSQNRELDCSQKERPKENLPVERQPELPLTPTRNGLASSTSQSRTNRRASRRMREDGKSGSSIHKETPVGKLIHDMDQSARGYGVD